jgi:cytochrome c oxidase subunit 1
MVGGVVMGFLGGLHFWWPKITGRLYSEKVARWAAVLIFLGFNFTFFPQFVLGYLGMPRRYHVYPEEWQWLNVLSTAGAAVLGAGYLLAIANFFTALVKGKPAGDNPWKAFGLEWETSSPPPVHNFEAVPKVREEAYAYDALAEEKP